MGHTTALLIVLYSGIWAYLLITGDKSVYMWIKDKRAAEAVLSVNIEFMAYLLSIWAIGH